VGSFDHVNHDTLLRILSKRITDKRFLHLIGQFLKAGYMEEWQYHQTYSGVPQGAYTGRFFGKREIRPKRGKEEQDMLCSKIQTS